MIEEKNERSPAQEAVAPTELTEYLSDDEIYACNQAVASPIAFTRYVRELFISRGLDKVQFDSASLFKNIHDETTELADALSFDAYDDERSIVDHIDAVLDTAIYIAVDSIKIDTVLKHETDVPADIFKWTNKPMPLPFHLMCNPGSFALLFIPVEMYIHKAFHEVFWFFDSLDDVKSAFAEVLYELTSRRGEWSDDEGKWVKDKTVSTYKADIGKHVCKDLHNKMDELLHGDNEEA